MKRKKTAMELLLEDAQPGQFSGVQKHIRFGERILEAVRNHFGVRDPRDLQAKHLRWVLDRHLADRSPATRYDYFRTCRAIASALGRWPDWKPYLHGPWVRPTGRSGPHGTGRPANLAGRR